MTRLEVEEQRTPYQLQWGVERFQLERRFWGSSEMADLKVRRECV